MRNPAECTLPRSVKGAVELGILLRCYPIGRLHDSGRAVRAMTSNNKAVPPRSGINKKWEHCSVWWDSAWTDWQQGQQKRCKQKAPLAQGKDIVTICREQVLVL